MGFEYVIVLAWVPPGRPDQGLPPMQPGTGQPPGIWGGAPIGPNPPYPDQGLPPSGIGIWPGYGQPSHPIAPGGPPPQVWPGPGRPDQGLPIPPQVWPGPGVPTHPIAPGGPPPTIWPGPGRPDQGLPVPPQIWPSPGRPDQGLPGWQPYPDQGLPPAGVGIWPSPGRPDQGLPPEQPGIWPGPGFGTGIWGGAPIGPNPPGPTFPIVIPPEQDMPDHPELPDLNAGDWMYVKDQGAVYTPAFVPWPLAVTHPDYNPEYPETGTPGTWAIIAYGGSAVWAWIPTQGSGEQPAAA